MKKKTISNSLPMVRNEEPFKFVLSESNDSGRVEIDGNTYRIFKKHGNIHGGQHA